MNRTATKKTEKKAALPMDRAELLERLGGEQEFIPELVGLYRDEFEAKLPLLKKAVEMNDAEIVRVTAHTMKGASANLSLPALRDAFLDMETAGRGNDLGRAHRLLSRIEREYNRLESFLAGLTSAA